MVEDLSVESLRRIAFDSIRQFLSREASEIRNDVAERSLCHSLAMCIDREKDRSNLHDYFVDVEYNRMQDGRIKMIALGRETIIRFIPDIVLHGRGTLGVDDENLIVFEMKKADHPQQEKDDDRNRLMALTKHPSENLWSYDGKTFPETVCGYKLGIYLELNRTTCDCIIEEYIRGSRVSSQVLNFSKI